MALVNRFCIINLFLQQENFSSLSPRPLEQIQCSFMIPGLFPCIGETGMLMTTQNVDVIIALILQMKNLRPENLSDFSKVTQQQ